MHEAIAYRWPTAAAQRVPVDCVRIYRVAFRLRGNEHDAGALTEAVLASLSSRRLRAAGSAVVYRTIVRMAATDALSRPSRPSSRYEVGDSCGERDVQPALDSMPPQVRAVVVLHDIEGLSYGQTGRALGVRTRTVARRLTEGRSIAFRALAGPLSRWERGADIVVRPLTSWP